MKTLLYVSLIFLSGCENLYNHNEPQRYEPVYNGVFVNSLRMLEARYIIPDYYIAKTAGDTTKRIYFPIIYSGKDISGLNRISFDSNKFQIIPSPDDTVTTKQYHAVSNYDSSYTIGMKVYLINTGSDTILSESIQDGSLEMLQQAKDKDGDWKSIECWLWSFCGNSYESRLIIPPGKYISVNAFRYKGGFKTELRFVLKWYNLKNKKNEKICSKSFKGSINKSQFDFEGEIMPYVDFFEK